MEINMKNQILTSVETIHIIAIKMQRHNNDGGYYCTCNSGFIGDGLIVQVYINFKFKEGKVL